MCFTRCCRLPVTRCGLNSCRYGIPIRQAACRSWAICSRRSSTRSPGSRSCYSQRSVGSDCPEKLLTAGLGAYALGRGLRIGVAGSVVAALVYMLCAPSRCPCSGPSERSSRCSRGCSWLRIAFIGNRPLSARPYWLWSWGWACWRDIQNPRCSRRELPWLPRRPLGRVGVANAGSKGDDDFARRASVAGRPGAWCRPCRSCGRPLLQAYSVSISPDVHRYQSPLPPSGLLLWVMPNIFGDARPHVYSPTADDLPYALLHLNRVLLRRHGAAMLDGVAIVRFRQRLVMIALVSVAVTGLLTALQVPPVSCDFRVVTCHLECEHHACWGLRRTPRRDLRGNRFSVPPTRGSSAETRRSGGSARAASRCWPLLRLAGRPWHIRAG